MSENEQKLPELPKHASGITCTLGDPEHGVEADHIDRENPDFMREKLDAVIKDQSIFEEGWRLESRGYSTMGRGGHHNLVLLDPEGNIFASLDTQQAWRTKGLFHDPGELGGYWPDGGMAAPVVDDCTAGNNVVYDHNHIGHIDVGEPGRGTQKLLEFAKAAEAGRIVSERNPVYDLSPDDSGREMNSNTLARLYAYAASDGQVDIYPTASNYDHLRWDPGMDVAPSKFMPEESFYDQIRDPDQIVLSKEVYDHMLQDFEALHPITQQKRAIEFGKAEAAQDMPRVEPAQDHSGSPNLGTAMDFMIGALKVGHP
ncbi:MAG: hypothetical protein KDI46_00045 [Alphaproteobacteria bacterium]|nr:hypothetical protein [Alphaproteobacteria bacterium]